MGTHVAAGDCTSAIGTTSGTQAGGQYIPECGQCSSGLPEGSTLVLEAKESGVWTAPSPSRYEWDMNWTCTGDELDINGI